MALTGNWRRTWALQEGRDEAGALLLWPEGMDFDGLDNDWVDFIRVELADEGRLRSVVGQEMLPLWRFDGERLLEDAPGAWLEKL